MQAARYAAIALIVGVPAYWAGRSSGIADSPEMAAVAMAEQEAINRDIAFLLQEPTGRDLVCEKIFDLVASEVESELMIYSEDIDAAPQRDFFE